MLEKRHFHVGLNTDDEDKLLQDGEYRFALNVRSGSSDEADTGAITNVKGNTLITFQLPGGVNQVVGTFEDKKNRRVIYYLFNSNDRHQILQYDISKRQISLILESEFLNFNRSFPIFHTDLIDDDLLRWTENSEEPSGINISRAIRPLGNPDGYPDPFIRQYIDVIKYPPICQPEVIYSNDREKAVNNLRNQLYQFKYRYLYPDNERSAWSPISKIPIPSGTGFKEFFTFISAGSHGNPPNVVFNGVTFVLPVFLNNNIILTLDAGDPYVTRIEIAGREANSVDGFEASGDFFSITTIDRVDLTIDSNNEFTFKFFNDGVYSSIEINESNKLYDRVPLKAATQAYIENRMSYGNILVDFDLVDIDVETEIVYRAIRGNVKSDFVGAVIDFQSGDNNFLFNSAFVNFKTPQQIGPGLLLVLQIASGPDLFQYAHLVTDTDTELSIINNFIDQVNNDPLINTRVIARLLFGTSFNPPGSPPYLNPTMIIDRLNSDLLEISTSESATIQRSHKKGARHEYAIVYYDAKNRSSSALTDDTFFIDVPLEKNFNTLFLVDAIITINHDPPPWATHYQILYSKNLATESFIQIFGGQITATPPGSARIKLTGLINFNNTFSESILSYSFTKGDRIRILSGPQGPNKQVKFEDSEIIKEGTDTNGQFIVVRNEKIKIVSNTFFELYTPKKNLQNKVYFEIGECFEIENGFHKGSIQDQNNVQGAKILLTNQGDVYIKNRSSAAVFEDFNYSDFFESGHANIGRPNIVDPEFKEKRLDSTIFVSEFFVENSNINGISSFFGFSFPDLPARAKEFDKNWGSIQRLYAENKRLIMFQELKVGAILVNESVIFDRQGVPTINKSDEILADIIYYEGEYGIGTQPGSFAVFGNRKYFADMRRGAVLRLSQNGITEISEEKMHNFFTDAFRDSLATIPNPVLIGFYDRKFKEYILHIKKVIPLEGTYGTAQSGGLLFITIPTEFTDFAVGITEITITFTNNITGQIETATISTINIIGSNNIGIPTEEAGGLPDGVLVSGDNIIINSILVPSGGDTIAFNEGVNRWVTFYSYSPEEAVAADMDIVTFNKGDLFLHNDNDIRNNFYGKQFSSIMEVIFNMDFSTRKFWLALTLEANKIWEAISITNQNGQKTNLIEADFENIEGDFYAQIRKDENTPVDNPLIEGDDMRSHELKVRLENKDTENVKMIMVGTESQASERTNK